MADSVWYFAYGSNMKTSVMIGRGITPLSIKVGVVPTHILTFDIFGIPYAEPSFASIAPVPIKPHQDAHPAWSTEQSRVPPVHGVLYQLKREDYRRLVLTEGAGVGYDEITVSAYILETTPGRKKHPTRASKPIIIGAQTLKAKYPWRPNRGPSQRYMVREIDLSLSD
jgi:hypothetical protein